MKTNAARILERLGIAYETRTYDVDEENLGAEAAAVKLGLPAGQVFKTLVARTDRKLVVLACLPGDTDLDLKALGAVAGAKRADLVPLQDVRPLTGYIRGGVSPVGTKRAFPTFIDRSAETWPFISVSAGIRGCQLLVAPQDLVRAVQATLCSISKPRE